VHSKINHSIRRELSGYNFFFFFIVDEESFFNWAKELINYTYIYAHETKNYTDIAYVNTFISDIRLVQRRIKLKKSKSVFKDYYWMVWKSRGFGATSSKNKHETDTDIIDVEGL
jgi:hypothetical protein